MVVIKAVVCLMSDEQGHRPLGHVAVICYVDKDFVWSGWDPAVEYPEGLLGREGLGVFEIHFDIDAL
jgi:hypothetical protein